MSKSEKKSLYYYQREACTILYDYGARIPCVLVTDTDKTKWMKVHTGIKIMAKKIEALEHSLEEAMNRE